MIKSQARCQEDETNFRFYMNNSAITRHLDINTPPFDAPPIIMINQSQCDPRDVGLWMSRVRERIV